jgi:hypothetical protein
MLMKNSIAFTRQLSLTASAAALGVALMGTAGSAQAQTVQLTGANNLYAVDNNPGQTIEITSGTNALMFPKGQEWLLDPGKPWAGALAITDENWGQPPGWGANNMTIGASPFGGANPNAAAIQVDSGASLRFLGVQSLGWSPWMALNNMMNAQGDVIFENMNANIAGNSTFAGNVTLLDNAQIYMGETWGAASAISFGKNTNITLNPGSQLYLRLTSGFTSTAGGALAGSGKLELASGTLVINGQNTASTPFTGTLQIDPGAVFVVGDASHPTAVLGDPGHPTGSGYGLNVGGTIGGSAKLQGYGTIYGTVSNSGGVVQPGGSSGVPGTLTVSKYSQDATGSLKIEVTPTAASSLKVLGDASLNGSLSVTINPGTYGTKVYDIVDVGGVMSGSFSSITTASGATGAIAAVAKSANGYQLVTEVVQGANASAPVMNGHLVSANRLNNYYFVNSLYDVIAVGQKEAGTAPTFRAWGEGFGHQTSISRDDVGYHSTAGGFTAGGEYRSPSANATAGVAFSYSTEGMRSKGNSTANIGTWHVAAYGGADVQYARLDGVLFYNGYQTTTKRDFQDNGIAIAKPNGYAYGGSVQLSHALFGGIVTPYLRGIFSRQHLNGSVESGATVLDLKYDAINANTFVGDFGLRIEPMRSFLGSSTKLLITAAVEHDFSKAGEIVDGEFPIGSGQSWNAYWKGDSENTALVGADVGYKLGDSVELYGRLNGRFSLYQSSGELAIGGRWRF